MNKGAYAEAKLRHDIAMQKLAKDRRQEQELNTLRREVEELKDLVKQLVEKNA
jgi:cell division protein FtsB